MRSLKSNQAKQQVVSEDEVKSDEQSAGNCQFNQEASRDIIVEDEETKMPKVAPIHYKLELIRNMFL